MISYEKVEEALEKFDEKIDDFLEYFDHLYHVVPPSSLGLVSGIVGISSIAIAIFLYILGDPTFSFFSHLISFLGVGPYGSGLVFNSGLIISSIFLFLFLMHSIRDFRKRGSNRKIVDALFIAAILTVSGIFFVAIIPYQPAEFLILHGIFAGIFFAGGLVLSILYTILVLTTPSISKVQAIVGLITACILIWHMYNAALGLVYGGLDYGGSEIAYLTEWVALFALIFMIIEISLYTYGENRLLHKKYLPERTIDYNGLNNDNISKLRKYIKSIRIIKK